MVAKRRLSQDPAPSHQSSLSNWPYEQLSLLYSKHPFSDASVHRLHVSLTRLLGRPAFRTGSPARPRMVVISVEVMRIPVSVSMRVRSSRLPSESRPYSERGRSGSMVRRRIRLTCSDTMRRSRVGHSSGAARPARHAICLRPLQLCRLDLNTSANRLRWAKAVNHGVPVIGA